VPLDKPASTSDQTQTVLGSDYKTRKRARRREEIIDAAEIVFAEKGFHNATLKNIADQLGVLPAALYHYVDSKEAALIEICRRTGHQSNKSMKAHLQDTRPVLDIIRDAIARHLHTGQSELVYTFAFRPRDLPADAQSELSRMAADYQEMWESLIARGVENGELKPDLDPHVTAIALLAMMNGSIDWYVQKSAAEIEDVAKQFTNIAFGGICES